MQRDRWVALKRTDVGAFEFYLRTGHVLVSQTADSVQVKFNPWHDPENGRFTFVGRGIYSSGKRASGGDSKPPEGQEARRSKVELPRLQRRQSVPGPDHSTPSTTTITLRPATHAHRQLSEGGPRGGGGATGSWSGPPHTEPFKPGGGSFAGGGASGSWTEVPANPKGRTVAEPAPPSFTASEKPTSRRVVKNGYNFDVGSDIGAKPRTQRISGELRLGEVSRRSRRAQSSAGGSDRQPSDDGGHFIGARFNGPHEWYNHFAQNSNFNRSAYLKIENGWARDIKAGKRVFVDIVPHYAGASTRPDRLIVIWYVDGRRQVTNFSNQLKGE